MAQRNDSRAEKPHHISPDVLITTEELATHWRLRPQTLHNWRSRYENAAIESGDWSTGNVMPYLRLPSGGIRYRMQDVIAAEQEGIVGKTVYQLKEELIHELPMLDDRMKAQALQYLRDKEKAR